MPQNPLSYREVKDLYDELKDAGQVTQSLPDWSSEMNRLSQSDVFGAGGQDNWIKQASVGVDRLLESTGLPNVLGDLGAAAGRAVGAEDVGRNIGQRALRGVVDFGPLLIPGLGQAGLAARGLAYAGTAALSGASAYEQSGSPTSGVLAGLTNVLMPGVANAAEKLVTNRVGSFFAGQGAAAAFGEGSAMAQAGLNPDAEYNFDPRAILLESTIGQLPFTAVHLAGKAFGIDEAIRVAQQREQDAATVKLGRNTPPVAKPTTDTIAPREATPTEIAKTQALLAKIRGDKTTLGSLGNSDDAERMIALTDEEARTMKSAIEQTGGRKTLFGEMTTPESERMNVVGDVHYENPKTGYRIVRVADDPANADLGLEPGSLIGYPGRTSAAPVADVLVPGRQLFAVPRRAYNEHVDSKAVVAEATTMTPDLPVQSRPGYEKHLEEVADFKYAMEKLNASQNGGIDDFRKAIMLYNGTLQKWGIRHYSKKRKEFVDGLDDDMIRELAQFHGAKTPVATVLGDVRLLMKQFDKREEMLAKQQQTEEGFNQEVAVLDDPNAAPETRTRAKELFDMYNNFEESGRGGKGAFSRLYNSWKEGGEQGGLDGLRTVMLKAKTSGAGAKKQVVVDSEKVVATNDPDVAPISAERQAVAARVAYETVGDFPDLASDAMEFAEAYGIGDRSALPEGARWDEWWAAADEELGSRKGLSRTIEEETKRRVSAGEGFVWDMIPYDVVTNRLGKHTLPKTGILKVAQFKNMAGEPTLSDTVITLGRELVPEAFEGDTVDVRKLYAGLKEKGPVVEVKKLEKGQATPQGRSAYAVQHEIETLGYRVPPPRGNDAPGLELATPDATYVPWNDPSVPAQVQALAKEYQELYASGALTPPDTQQNRAKYSFLGPKSEQDMPGYVEGLVRVPKDPQRVDPVKVKIEQNEDGTYSPTIFGRRDLTKKFNTLEEAQREFASPIYSGPHFGSEDTNVLAFFRGYEETIRQGVDESALLKIINDRSLPIEQRQQATATLEAAPKVKAFHVIEVQSDWGQERRTQEEANAKREIHPKAGNRVPSHPLLSVYEPLALKAAIDHARSVGAEAIILSDGETAMMTEGHDKQPTQQQRRDVGQWYAEDVDGTRQIYYDEASARREAKGRKVGQVKPLSDKDIPQSAGMRLHYDTTLPSAMKKLTGVEGERVEVGVHDKATEPGTTAQWGDEQYFDTEQQAKEFAGTTGLVRRLNDGSFAAKQREGKPVLGSPVFRNPDGTPKSNITGRLYDLRGAFAKQDAQGGFTLTGASRTLDEGVDLVGKTGPSPFGATGSDLTTFLAADPTDRVSVLGLDFARFKNALSRIDVQTRASGGSHAFVLNGRVVIELSPSLAAATPSLQRLVIGHELAHGLTLDTIIHEPNSPLVRELDTLRLRMADALPPKMRVKYDEAVRSNWITKFNRGLVGADSLSPNYNERQILYSLLNTKEFAAQGFSSEPVQKYMKGQSGNGKWWTSFVQIVKRVLGVSKKFDDTAFGEFLSKTEQIMDRGEYIASVKNFSDNWFRAKSLSEIEIERQTRRVSDVITNTSLGASKDSMVTDLISSMHKGREQQQATGKLAMMLQQRGPDFENATAVMDELGLGGTTVGAYDELVLSHVAGDGKVPEALDLLPLDAAEYIFSLAHDARDTLDAVRAMTGKKNAKLVGVRDPGLVQGPAKAAVASLDQLLAAEERQRVARATLTGLQTVAPDAFLSSISRTLEDELPPERRSMLQAVGEAVNAATKPIGHFLGPMAQLSQSNPLFGEWYSKALLLTGKINHHTTESMKPLLMDPRTGETSARSWKEMSKTWMKLLEVPNVRQAFDDMLWVKQNRNKKAVKQVSYDDPEMVAAMSKLTKAERDQLIQLDSITRLMKVTNDQISLDAYQQILASWGARIIMPGTNLRADKATALSNDLLSALKQDFTNPEQAAVGNAKIASVQQALASAPDVFLNLLEFTQTSANAWKALSTHYVNNPDWVSAQRGGKYLFEYWKNGKVVLASAANKADAMERSGGLPIENFRKNEKFETALDFGDDPNGDIARIEQYEDNLFNHMEHRGVDPMVLQSARQEMSIARQARRDATAQNVRIETPQGRGLKRGAEYLPWFENHIDWVHKASAYWQKRLLKTTGETMMLDPEVAAVKETQGMIKQHMDQLLQPDPEVGRVVQKVASTWSLGFNVATQIANSAQTYTRGVTELIGLGLGPIDAVREMNRTWADLAKAKLTDKEVFSPEEQKFLKGALQDGQLNATITDDNAALSENVATDFKRIINKHRPKTLGQHAMSAGDAYSRASMMMFRMGEYANNKAMLVSAFRTLRRRDPNLSFDELTRQAYLTNAAVNDVGGRANRPLGLYSGKGDFSKSVAMMAGSLQSYTMGTIGQLSRHLKAGLFRPAGLTPAEISSARKAAIYMLGTQLAAAGGLGMPFVSGALALINQMFPELEVNKKLRESVAMLFGDDEKNGNILSDMALSGLPSMMGWDFQSRLSVGNVLPGVSEYNGFQPEQLLGVPANIVANFVRGGKKLAAGDLSGGYGFVPPAIKKLVELGSEGGAMRDNRGRPVLTPSPGEAAGLVLGFNPKRFSDFNVADRIAEQNRLLSTQREGQFHQQLAEETLKGNFGTVRARLVSRAEQEKGYDPVEAAQSVARAAEELTFPRDLRREDTTRTAAGRSSVLRSFGMGINPSKSVNEVDRLKFRAQVAQRLGAPMNVTRELKKAQLMDAMSQQQPTATRSQLRAAAEAALRSSRTRSLLPE